MVQQSVNKSLRMRKRSPTVVYGLPLQINRVQAGHLSEADFSVCLIKLSEVDILRLSYESWQLTRVLRYYSNLSIGYKL